eukprot:TRINITY_DN7336_c0_g1_i4.p1 TRINITY_DN7336_c0_g1~~TRINITY_DN7336_c0_g1_i4.p1  ORF type:complete len:160 (+),score=26.14 TRINITY_DN7336_c0_g1_i4:84-563(+)
MYSSWIWSQAFSSDNTVRLALAGGEIMGLRAYLIGYRAPGVSWSFRPFTTLCVGGWSMGMTERHDREEGMLDLHVYGWRRKLVLHMKVPKDSYMHLACPLATGHEPDYAVESFHASISLEAYTRPGPWGSWRLVHTHTFENAALEFGGKYAHEQKTKEA